MRIWSSAHDGGAVHAMGNGQMLAYGRGPELAYLYGPPYSSPSLARMELVPDAPLNDHAQRLPGGAIWRHTLTDAASHVPVTLMTECVHHELPVYLRRWEDVACPLRWRIHLHPSATLLPASRHEGAWLVMLKPGAPIYHYPAAHWSWGLFLTEGACRLEAADDGTLLLTCQRGEGSLRVVGATSYAALADVADLAASLSPAQMLAATQRWWEGFRQRRTARMDSRALADDAAAELLDGVAALLKAQQSTDGGVMAGHYYPLAYVRDQYGASRGMLALGMHAEARAGLQFRANKLDRLGTLQTAESMGSDCARHIHENDDVEGPGYLILQARDYLGATGDVAFVRSLMPLLDWCWEAQRRHLWGGLLPFNGDETYVAGGFYPRSGLMQGSADSTLVYAVAGAWLADWAQAQGLWPAAYAEAQRALAAQAARAYRRHFMREGRLFANAPIREELGALPAHRHGVCEARCGWFGWTERSSAGRYLCPACAVSVDLPPERPEPMLVHSVSLLPSYVGSDLLSDEELRRLAEGVLAAAQPDGHIPTVPGTIGCVGYDPGLLLMTLTRLRHRAAPAAYARLVRMADDAGAWNEYYGASDQVRAQNCRARPWESGVNAAAMVAYWSASGDTRPANQ